MPCCAKQQRKKKLQNRCFSSKTIQKMQNSALYRPLRNGKPRKWRKTQQYKNWRNLVFQMYSNQCAITAQSNTKLVAHHLMDVKSNEKFCFVPANGIVITAQLHKSFHDH